MKIYRLILLCILALGLLVGCTPATPTPTATPTPSEEASASSEQSEESKQEDHAKFAEEYTEVTADNVFVFRTQEEIKNILEHGTGIVYLGFPGCPWCQRYVVYLNEVAQQKGIDKIYYYNIADDRKENTEFYQWLVARLEGLLLFDSEGKPRIYVPDISFVIQGEIVAHDNETSVVTEADGTPDDYWTEERVSALKEKLGGYIDPVVEALGCSACNLTD